MKIEIYQKRRVFNSFVVDDSPCAIYENVSNIQIESEYIYGDINGEQLTIKTDHFNNVYTIR